MAGHETRLMEIQPVSTKFKPPPRRNKKKGFGIIGTNTLATHLSLTISMKQFICGDREGHSTGWSFVFRNSCGHQLGTGVDISFLTFSSHGFTRGLSNHTLYNSSSLLGNIIPLWNNHSVLVPAALRCHDYKTRSVETVSQLLDILTYMYFHHFCPVPCILCIQFSFNLLDIQ